MWHAGVRFRQKQGLGSKEKRSGRIKMQAGTMSKQVYKLHAGTVQAAGR
jgi:hypothetical protein